MPDLQESDRTGQTAYRRTRQAMVEEQLRRRGISDERVLEAMRQTPRHAFVTPELRDSAYRDSPLPIGSGQTISQPYTVAFMCEAAGLRGTERVLEVGAGSGYGAAVLAHLSAHVDTVERVPELAEEARQTLSKLGYANVSVHLADGSLGWAENAPFDAIIVTAGAKTLPVAYADQLAQGGRLIIPIGTVDAGQTMYRLTKQDDKLNAERLGNFSFVPLVEGST
ncbi:MAG: protein-L-isoaspartate(D-aspartate) O-methyltransferase [Planctomycetota bacterium]